MEITQLVKQVVLRLDPQAEVIVFGSRARGDHNADSDWDFLVLMDKPLTPSLKGQVLDNIYEVELRTEAVISSLIHDKREWEKMAISPIYQIIQKEGKRA